MLACRRQLIDEIMLRKQQLEHLQGERPRPIVVEMIDYLTIKEKELDKAIDGHVAAHDELQALVDLLTTMRGCGRIFALTLITDMPELGQLDRQQIAALAGLAPIAKDSGLRENQRVTKGGRGQVRKVADKAAVSAIRASDNPFKARYLALVARRKPKKTRHRRRQAHHARHPQRHGQGQQAVEAAARRLTKQRLLSMSFSLQLA